ncbi:MAG: LytTR family transcriptional regulator DNA-binding domain-containing protein [Prevotellaceae bacterium]|nr:LytTR family transcriptional regulator DNA-binding domain-containing protein [Prevotellaceae bacterium]
MKLNCAILNRDDAVAGKLREYIGKVPFLTLCGVYRDPLEALRNYYELKVELYFVGICPVAEDEVDGMAFCKLLTPPTRVIFVADSGNHAADCFRLDALDYLSGDFDFSTFSQSVGKANRWFALQGTALPANGEGKVKPRVLYIHSDNRIVRLVLAHIHYIEGLGDYVKIYYKDNPKPVLSLCSMKYLEERLPTDEFIRVHRSFIVRKDCIDAIGRSMVVVEKRDVPIGDAYRERVKGYISHLSVL